MKTFLGLLVCIGLVPAASFGQAAGNAFRGNVVPESGVKTLTSAPPAWIGSETYHGSGILLEGEQETAYDLSIHFSDDGLIETTVYTEDSEETFAYQWVFSDDDSGEFSVVVFDEEGNPETIGEGLCSEDSCHMTAESEDGYLEESFYFEDSFLYKDGYFATEESEAVWEEMLEAETEDGEEDSSEEDSSEEDSSSGLMT